jgi:hypothetical protein
MRKSGQDRRVFPYSLVSREFGVKTSHPDECIGSQEN